MITTGKEGWWLEAGGWWAKWVGELRAILWVSRPMPRWTGVQFGRECVHFRGECVQFLAECVQFWRWGVQSDTGDVQLGGSGRRPERASSDFGQMGVKESWRPRHRRPARAVSVNLPALAADLVHLDFAAALGMAALVDEAGAFFGVAVGAGGPDALDQGA